MYVRHVICFLVTGGNNFVRHVALFSLLYQSSYICCLIAKPIPPRVSFGYSLPFGINFSLVLVTLNYASDSCFQKILDNAIQPHFLSEEEMKPRVYVTANLHICNVLLRSTSVGVRTVIHTSLFVTLCSSDSIM